MSEKIWAYAAKSKGAKLEPFEFDPGPLGPEDVEIAVEYCGMCHSDLSMLDDDLGMTAFPLVPGHEVGGGIVAIGDHVTSRQVGQRVGLGWMSGSCMACASRIRATRTCVSTPNAIRQRSCTGMAVSPIAYVLIGSGRRHCPMRWTTPRPVRCFAAGKPRCSIRSSSLT